VEVFRRLGAGNDGRLNGSRGRCLIRSGFDEVVPGDHRVRGISGRPGSIVGARRTSVYYSRLGRRRSIRY
jgi:hypothetical protein